MGLLRLGIKHSLPILRTFPFGNGLGMSLLSSGVLWPCYMHAYTHICTQASFSPSRLPLVHATIPRFQRNVSSIYPCLRDMWSHWVCAWAWWWTSPRQTAFMIREICRKWALDTINSSVKGTFLCQDARAEHWQPKWNPLPLFASICHWRGWGGGD